MILHQGTIKSFTGVRLSREDMSGIILLSLLSKETLYPLLIHILYLISGFEFEKKMSFRKSYINWTNFSDCLLENVNFQNVVGHHAIFAGANAAQVYFFLFSFLCRHVESITQTLCCCCCCCSCIIIRQIFEIRSSLKQVLRGVV